VRILGPDGKTILRVMAAEQLPSDPYRSQVEAFVDDARAPVLTEHGEVTMRGALESSLKLIQIAAAELVGAWTARRQNPSQIVQPKENWLDGPCVKSTGFSGYKPGSLLYDPTLMISHRDMAKQLKTAALADDLRHLWKSFD
jgi:hypothetical protein